MTPVMFDREGHAYAGLMAWTQGRRNAASDRMCVFDPGGHPIAEVSGLASPSLPFLVDDGITALWGDGLASYASDGTQRWHLPTSVKNLFRPPGRHPDGRVLALGWLDEDGECKLHGFDPETGERSPVLLPSVRYLGSLPSFDRHGRMLVVDERLSDKPPNVQLVVFNKEGEEAWRRDLGERGHGKAIFGLDGDVAIRCRDRVVCFDSDGEERWSLPVEPENHLNHAGVTFGPAGMLYWKAGAEQGGRAMYARHVNGGKVFELTVDGEIRGRPAFTRDGRVHFVTTDGRLHVSSRVLTDVQVFPLDEGQGDVKVEHDLSIDHAGRVWVPTSRGLALVS